MKKELLLDAVSALSEKAEIRETYAEHLCDLFEHIDGTKIGEAYCRAAENGDIAAMIRLLAAYYRQKPSAAVDWLTAQGPYDVTVADRAVRGEMREVNIDWTFEGGEVDFLFDPTAIKGPRNHEWLWQLNRHNYWKQMVRAYAATKDETYARAFRAQLLRWIAQTCIPDNWNGPGSAWRTIECGIRMMGAWPAAFDGFRKSASIEDVTLLLMVASMHKQTVHLVSHPTMKNWLMMESNGVYTISALFGELTDSADNRRIAAERLLSETVSQILPDGMHNELSPDYQLVVFGCAADFFGLANALGYGDEIPTEFADVIRSTVDAAIRLSTPGLTQPRTNDTYTITLTRFTRNAAELLGDTPVYRYFNSARAEGTPPAGDTASAYLPYAGFAAMRSDWSADAAYLCFDVGPLGMAHIHQDMLNLHLYRGDEELLYDDGGGQYELSDARQYALSAYAHNTLLVDGLAQNRSAPYIYETPYDAHWISCAEFDYAQGVYNDTFGAEKIRPAVHTRKVRFCKPGFFCVVDELVSADGEAHDYEVLFHLDTTHVNGIAEYPNAVMSDFGRKYDLLMIPLDADASETAIVSAQTEPMLRGWYNGRNDRDLHAATTVSRRISGVRDTRFVTLLFPMRAGDALPAATVSDNGELRVVFEGKDYVCNLNALDERKG